MRNQEKRYHSRYMLFVMLIFYTLSMYSQKITVKGKVIDAANNLEVIGAAVQVEGNSLGTITDIDGNFVLQGVPEKGNLVFSFVGYKTVKAAIKNGKFYNIKLQEDTKVLDEVVVVGYGSMRKKEGRHGFMIQFFSSLMALPDLPSSKNQGKTGYDEEGQTNFFLQNRFSLGSYFVLLS